MKEKKYVSDIPHLNAEWHPTMNGDLKPSMVTLHSRKKVWWLCTAGHAWMATADSRSKGGVCPYDMGKLPCPGYNDFSTTHPNLAKEWHQGKNGNLKPSEVTAFSNKKVWWKCKNSHEWIASVRDRCKGRGCPYCETTKIWAGFNEAD